MSALEGNQDCCLSRGLNSWEKNMVNVSLERLLALAEAEAVKRSAKPEYVLGEIGLFLERPIHNEGYYPTPINTSTFARTGGDYVHYGLMHINGEATDNSPVIMTLPFNRKQLNFVVGEDIGDFLCLGCEVGYFGLENLAYHSDDMLDLLSRPDHPDREECTADDQELLNALTQAFSLTPWKQVQTRLEQLHEKYHDLLKLPLDD